MFVLVRNNKDGIEVLKDSSTDLDKMFPDFDSANVLAAKLNQHTASSLHWTVEERNI